jgi:hypothetical protein
MNSKLFKIIIALSALLLCMPVVLAQKEKVKEKEKEQEEQREQEQEARQENSVAADPAVVITMCLESGSITVTGGDRREVRASAQDGKVILRRKENPNAATPATRLEVIVLDSDKQSPATFGECRGSSDLELEVPRGATVYVKTRDGDIDVSDITEVRAETSSGSIMVQHVTREVEATSIDGDISVEESSGRIRLHTFRGSIETINAKMVEPNDFIDVRTTSGDVRLEDVEQPHVEVSTISGEISLSGPLARGGFYDLKTISSDITFNLPDTVTFQLTAKVSQGGEVVTDFPLRYTGGPSAAAIAAGKITGTYGTGAAPSTINLVSFSGTLRLRKK